MLETAGGRMGKTVCYPFFFPTARGRLFAVQHRPPAGIPVRGHVLCVQPFNEEMNRCRSMVTLQADALAGSGFGTLVVDLFGTGDSEGEYGDARWDIWLDNLAAAAGWLDQQPGGCRALWGIRLGAMLAAELQIALQRPELALILWQPVADGKLHLTQFLRVRIAAQMDRPNLPKETTSGMRERLASGHSVEVAGYEIHPELAAAIDAAAMGKRCPLTGTRVLWLENATADDADISPASLAVIEQWKGQGIAPEMTLFPGPAFWQLHERVLAPAIIGETCGWLQRNLGTT